MAELRILWIINNPLPEAKELLQGGRYESDATGSWVCALAERVACWEGVSLFVASPSSEVQSPTRLQGKMMVHWLLPIGSVAEWTLVQRDSCPAVVHIHGTEKPFGLSYVNQFGREHVVVSLQGMVSEISKYYYAGMTFRDRLRCVTVRDVVRKDTTWHRFKRMCQQADRECELLRKVHHVIGRTDWDREVALRINPDLHYHFCNELLRTPFYKGDWSIDTCTPHRIFVGQGNYPLKGLHVLLRVLPNILDRYPDTTVHVAGPDVVSGNDLRSKILRQGYGRFVRILLRHYHLRDCVTFIGPSSAETMRNELLAAQVCLSTSSIENSSNMICEAQLLGVPCVASAVGGTQTLIPDSRCGRCYAFGDTEALSQAVMDTFSQPFANAYMRTVAQQRHNPDQMLHDQMEIYQSVSQASTPRVAVLMTVYNRRESTLRCLRQLFSSQCDATVEVFLTNDGCTDGTPEAVSEQFPQVHIVQGNGSLFWNRGMYAAWQEAGKGNFDYYFWLNDDTYIYPDTLARMVQTSRDLADTALVVGSTSKVGDASTITYGGWVGDRLLTDVSQIQQCETVNGNIVLVPRSVFLLLGPNDPYYRHAVGDTDYALRAHEAGLEVWVAQGVLGECNLHERPTPWRDPSVPLRKRWKNLFSPTGNNPIEFFHFRKRHYGFLPACKTFVTNMLHVLFPRMWTRRKRDIRY